jgi:hypothetical protein
MTPSAFPRRGDDSRIRWNVASNETMRNAGANATEEEETYAGKIVGGSIAAVLLGDFAIPPIAVMVAVVGLGLGNVFD